MTTCHYFVMLFTIAITVYNYIYFFVNSAEVESARLATVLQENAVLKSELDMLRHKLKNMLEENRRLRQASVNIVSVKPRG